MIPIRSHGSLLRADSNGFLVRDADAKKISPPWSAAVDFVKQAAIKNLSDSLHSIYIRGSVPRGLAVEGISDIDTYFIMHGNRNTCQQLDLSWVDKTRSEFSQRFPFAAGMERLCIPLDDIIDEGQNDIRWRFMIKTSSVCLYGEDLALNIPPFKISQIPGPKDSALAKNIEFFGDKIAAAPDDEEIKDGCRWLMKRFIREGMRLVMQREQAYTRDLYPAYECFARYYPKKKESMRQALEYAINPIGDMQLLSPFVATFGTWLCGTCESHIEN